MNDNPLAAPAATNGELMTKQGFVNGLHSDREFPAPKPNGADAEVEPEGLEVEMPTARKQQPDDVWHLIKPFLLPSIFAAGVIFNSYQNVAALKEEVNQTRAELKVAQNQISNLRAASEVRDSLDKLEKTQLAILEALQREKRR